MNLLGVDVGFSKTQKSTGVAVFHNDELTVYRANSTWEDRKSQLPVDFVPEAIAIDGPLLPDLVLTESVRPCEQFFSRGLFCKRCKPGLSHFGTGYSLRSAAFDAVHQFAGHCYGPDFRLGHEIAEAFPNLFLGVMVEDGCYRAMPKLIRGQKFDWLYDNCLKKLDQLREFVPLTEKVYSQIQVENDHEMRAALVCLLTAGLAAKKTAVRAGCDLGGWFWLPPMPLWEPWAIEAAEANFGSLPQPASSE